MHTNNISKTTIDKVCDIFDTKETVIELNNVKMEAFPSHLLDANLIYMGSAWELDTAVINQYKSLLLSSK
jgi:hypothetical protein